MALKFTDTKGSAQKDKLENYKFLEGQNSVRLVGDIVPRYVYWVEGQNGKNLPFECLSYDRNAESFTNLEQDHVQEFFPDKQCTWAYAGLCIDNGQLKILNHKKKLYQQILVAAQDLGDPTDPDNGWDIVYDRKKTGPNAYNVEYTLLSLKCKPRPLTDEEKEATIDMKSMDEILARPTPDAQKALLMKITGTETEEMDDSTEGEFDDDNDSFSKSEKF
jgi:hypothetical protein